MLVLWILGVGVVAALTARLYFGVTIENATMYVAMRTPIGRMIHDLKLSRTQSLQHSKPAMHGSWSWKSWPPGVPTPL